MKILIVGGGGREHALVWKISKSPKVKKIFCAPGNPGMSDIATCVPINPEDISGLLNFAKANDIDLTIVGPEDPLSKGISDIFTAEGLKIFGPSKKAAQIESSKFFAKSLMMKYKIPTAIGKVFTDYEEARAYLYKQGMPIVIKADGLAAGKGVFVTKTIEEAEDALKQIMILNVFGDAGKKVLIEECLKGEEASFIAFTDGKTVLPLPSSQDHKPIFDGDQGPNTGGMGAYSPAPVVDAFFYRKIMKDIMYPAVRAMEIEGCHYKGVLYAGLMINRDKIKVLEFNCRFGDPETQPIMLRLKTDIVPVMEAVIEGRLNQETLEIDSRPSVCVVMASSGYPNSYKKGLPINGLEPCKANDDTAVFHAGTSLKDNKIVTNGGRVLGVSALGDTISDAIKKAYDVVSKISWENVHYRNDIGNKAIKRLKHSPEVGIVMGSDSDLEIMEEAVSVLKNFGISYEITIASAHRTPLKAKEFAASAKGKGIKVIIAGAGHAAHLAGSIAANTSLPVIGVPIDSSSLKGLDSLLSTVQMPPGVPVAAMAIGKPGARNAGIFAAQIISVSNSEISKKMEDFKMDMEKEVYKKDKQILEGI